VLVLRCNSDSCITKTKCCSLHHMMLFYTWIID
jgi:hypothetical protein